MQFFNSFNVYKQTPLKIKPIILHTIFKKKLHENFVKIKRSAI